jgi:hypothetical protein
LTNYSKIKRNEEKVLDSIKLQAKPMVIVPPELVGIKAYIKFGLLLDDKPFKRIHEVDSWEGILDGL